MTYFTKTARRAGLAAVAAMMLTSAPALGEATEFFKCTMAEGTTAEDLAAMGKDAAATMAENGVEGVSVAFLFPLYDSDISEGTFYWQATAANFAVLGAMNDLWETDANVKVRARWNALVDDCENSNVYDVVRAE